MANNSATTSSAPGSVSMIRSMGRLTVVVAGADYGSLQQAFEHCLSQLVDLIAPCGSGFARFANQAPYMALPVETRSRRKIADSGITTKA
jgi:hypothetical protein